MRVYGCSVFGGGAGLGVQGQLQLECVGLCSGGTLCHTMTETSKEHKEEHSSISYPGVSSLDSDQLLSNRLQVQQLTPTRKRTEQELDPKFMIVTQPDARL